MIRPRKKPRAQINAAKPKPLPMARKGYIHGGVLHHFDGREECLKTVSGRIEYHSRTYQMSARQGYRCALCGSSLLGDATFEHQAGRGMGGSRRDDRIEIDGKWHNAATHERCNALKGSKRYEWRGGLFLPC